ncbi:MAG: tetratricopeptide repeat protein, partial [Stellaceae bacterium]
MHRSIWILALLVSIAFAAPVLAQSRDENWKRCTSDDSDLAIGGCTALIQSGNETTPNLAIAFANRCIAYHNKSDNVRAVQDCDQAIRLSPNYASAFSERGVINYDRGDYDHSIQDLSRAIQLKPDNAIALNNRGNAYSSMGQHDQAIS